MNILYGVSTKHEIQDTYSSGSLTYDLIVHCRREYLDCSSVEANVEATLSIQTQLSINRPCLER